MTRWLDGEGFADWAEEVVNVRRFTENDRRNLLRWRKPGRAVSEWTAERFLFEFGLRLDLVPDRLWRESPLPQALPEVIRRKAIERVRGGEPCKQVARSLTVDRNTVRRWVREAVGAK